ncbi:lysophospholipid acyltransferase family protein [Acanthopleuribacter pedis]|uniref:Lysophospholipid acyltransferase family protein n=1 Tax=Acanthopleuribacter pedis TaxID=442870 RepID=A0A8J7QPL4_9BACT|nr:lysophospholipid acyltransferase family protein [Acanthopleuribacter pedis]MBO1321775.1 lysophospholipid acyltransferase family protein [Acanthopleuribacter pedis]
MSEVASNQPIPDTLKTRALGVAIAWVMRFITGTSRFHFHDAEHLTQFFGQDRSLILASWHNRNLLAAQAYLALRPKGRVIRPLVSNSRDGGMAARAMRSFGIECVRGSSSRGGFAALKNMMRLLKQGQDVAITPDGPRGPVYTVQGGVATTAKMTGAPIIPMVWQAKRRKELNNWDRFIVPFPFNSIHVAFGEPMIVPRDCPAVEIEALSEKLRVQMVALTEKVDQLAQS